jgi:hypothetical protein
MTKEMLTSLLKDVGLGVEALESQAVGTKTLRYYHIDKNGKRLDEPVIMEDLKKALDMICKYVHR